LGKILKIPGMIKEGLEHIPLMPAEVEVKKMEGNWHLTMGFKEDNESNAVYMLVDLGAAFDPLFGVEVNFPVPALKLVEIIPKKLREHIADIQAYFGLEGKFFLNVSIGRFAPDELNAKGSAGGIIGVSLNFKVEVGAKKVLKILAKAGTEIKLEGFVQAGGVPGNGDELKVYAQWLVEFGGLTGTIAWDVWDGTFTHENTWRFVDPQPIYESPKHLLFG
jgi:hypothetical protein